MSFLQDKIRLFI